VLLRNSGDLLPPHVSVKRRPTPHSSQA
jgi:hypothetical protein